MVRLFCLFIISIFLLQGVYAQEDNRTIPNMLRRPDRGEAPRLPMDLVIGTLGQGDAPIGAFNFARSLLIALTEGNNEVRIVAESRSIITGNNLEEISGIRTRNYRIGGGRIENDGSVSFLIRFIGLEESITGEIFLRRNEDSPETWFLDDLILEERRLLRDINDSYRFDFTPYERFF
ncbi:MAG: hypothetical protein FWG77_10410 [Treponema sp.]|nr:hypothetical protein [Treponema sp.]